MRPNAEELLRGIQASLLTYVLPEVQSPYARSELMVVSALLSIVADSYDGAAQELVEDNAGLRELARRGAESDIDDLANELRTLASASDDSARVSDLARANEALREAITRLAIALDDDDQLRAAIVDGLRKEAEARPALLGPRADG